MTATLVLNYALYQTGWLACMLGAASQHQALGVGIAIALVCVHLILTREPLVDLRLIALALGLGLAGETLQLHLGTYTAGGPSASTMPPAWLLVLWAQFATVFRYSLRGIMTAPTQALLFGALGGPLAFVAGDRLGALSLLRPLTPGLVRLSIGWAGAMLVCSIVTRRLCPPGSQAPVYRVV